MRDISLLDEELLASQKAFRSFECLNLTSQDIYIHYEAYSSFQYFSTTSSYNTQHCTRTNWIAMSRNTTIVTANRLCGRNAEFLNVRAAHRQRGEEGRKGFITTLSISKIIWRRWSMNETLKWRSGAMLSTTTMWLPLSLQGELRRQNLLQAVLHRDNI